MIGPGGAGGLLRAGAAAAGAVIVAASRLATGTHADVPVAPVVFSHADEVVKGEGFQVIADRRIFAVMALLNATGYDREADGQTMHPVRVQVREAVERALASSPAKRQAWRKFVGDSGLAHFQFMDYALSLCAETPFRRIRPDEELTYPKTARALRDLRMPRKDAYTIVNVPNLLDTHYQSIAAHYENYYYSVESPGSHSYDLNVHEYLHGVVNNLVASSYGPVKGQVKPYYQAGKEGPYAATNQNPLTFTYECLVRALDHRMAAKLKPEVEKRAQAVADEETAKGLTLVRPLYDLLPGFEASDKSFEVYLPELLRSLPAGSPASVPPK
jgi:hypothetical protein